MMLIMANGPEGNDIAIERIWPTKDTLSEFLANYKDHGQRYEFAKEYAGGKDVADIACGAGYGSYILGDVARKVVGFDVSDDALSYAANNFMRPNVTFWHVANISEYEFDVIISFETIEHMDENDGDMFLQKLHSSLKDDGVLLISTPINRNEIKYKVNVTKYHLREYDEFEFNQKLIKNGFCVKQRFGQVNSVTNYLTTCSALGFSWMGVIHSGIHRLIPERIRRPLAKFILGNELKQVNDSVRIVPENLSGAFVQILVCEKRRSDG
ncbi:MAG: class I SAM-dependent methyltransferase [Geobacter sp.]|nr:class I SAM-dependent methyltransferase [Geobacter sp.]